MFKNKKAYAHHIAGGLIFGLLLGALFMYLVAKGIVPLDWNICACP